MDEARLIRTVHFSATHHYRRGDWSEEENRRAFGPQMEPHAHDWRVEIHVVGPIDEATGWAADLVALDRALEALTAGWDGGNLNLLVPPVRDGVMTPSTENLARWIFGALTEGVAAPARLAQVRVFESADLGSAYPA